MDKIEIELELKKFNEQREQIVAQLHQTIGIIAYLNKKMNDIENKVETDDK